MRVQTWKAVIAVRRPSAGPTLGAAPRTSDGRAAPPRAGGKEARSWAQANHPRQPNAPSSPSAWQRPAQASRSNERAVTPPFCSSCSSRTSPRQQHYRQLDAVPLQPAGGCQLLQQQLQRQPARLALLKTSGTQTAAGWRAGRARAWAGAQPGGGRSNLQRPGAPAAVQGLSGVAVQGVSAAGARRQRRRRRRRWLAALAAAREMQLLPAPPAARLGRLACVPPCSAPAP